MKLAALDSYGSQFLVRDFNPRGIGAAIEVGADAQTGFGRGVGNQVDDHGPTHQGAPTPVPGNVAEHALFDLVPLAGAGREVTDAYPQAGAVGKPLQGHLPQARTTAVTAATVCGH